MKPLLALLEEARTQSVFSGYQLYAKKNSHSPLNLAGGATSHWPEAVPVTEETFFDIGSVTKAVVTSTLFALAVDKGELKLGDKLGKWAKEFVGTPLEKLELRQLLGHSAGVLWWHPVFKETDKRGFADWARKNAGMLCPSAPGTSPVYSDIGFLLLGLVIERQWGDLAATFEERVVRPLGLEEVKWGPLPAASCAATEYHLAEKRILHGEVFDDNARGWGGKSSHAGLFATARGLARWAEEWLAAWHGRSGWLGEKTAKLFTARSELSPGSTWALGWDTKSEKGSSAGKLFSAQSFGHLGYPGCSVWIDPKNGGFAVFHTNRVHPSRLDERIRQLRPAVHDAVVKYW